MRRDDLVVYGAYGFTGRLLLERLKGRGVGFVVAGRDARRTARVAAEFGAAHRSFSLDDRRAVDRALAGVGVLVNCAGPFRVTTEPLVAGCLRNRVHYLDVSGEVAPLEHAAALGAEAKARKIMLLPGIGFDVVPSDCLAVHLARRLPGAERLSLSISGSNLFSRGSALTFADHAGIPVYVRRAGTLEPMRFRTQMRWVDFGFDVRPTIAVSWGDLVTAFRSTGISDIEVYFEATAPRLAAVVGNQYLGWMLRPWWAKVWLKTYVGMMPDGPRPEERLNDEVVIVAEVVRGARRAVARLHTPEAYTFTGIAGAAVVEQVLAGAVAVGFQTPGSLLGADFVLSLPGVRRQDVS